MGPDRTGSPSGTPASAPRRRRCPAAPPRAGGRAASAAAAPCTYFPRLARHRRSAWTRTYTLRVPAARLYAASVRLEDLRRTPVPDLHRLYVEEERDLPSGGLSALKEDPRAGARAVAEKIEKRNHEAQAEGRRLTRLCAFEQPLWDQGIMLVAGVDEVGMAPLAGPVIAAAVILQAGCRIKNVNDSKQLTPEERDELEPEIRAQAVAVGIGRAEIAEIDSINIYRAGLLALKRAVLALCPQPQHLLVDARKLDGLTM